MGKVKVAGIQSACGPSKEENVARAVELAGLAAESGAKIVCFQELFSTFWFPRERNKDFLELAEDESGPTLGAMRELAREKGLTLVCPIYEKGGDHHYNTAFVIGPEGETVGKYRKLHIPELPLWEEKFYFAPGDTGLPVFTSQGLTFGVQLCWDNFFPEGARELALKGADLIFSPTAAAFASWKKWETVICANAIVNNMYLFRVNRVGHEEKQDFYGKSFCADPEGELLMPPSGMSGSVIVADINPDLIEEVRREWNFFQERRSDAYGQ